jgi:hypothetical protein
LHVKNPFGAELVSFLHIWLLAAAPVLAVVARQGAFSFDSSPNGLVPLVSDTPSMPLKASIGQFTGRQEAIYRLASPAASVYALVLTGAFELEGRLLHEKDGLALWDASSVELEALSNGAVLLLLELESKN